MALDQKDIEAIERIIYKNIDDIAVSFGRTMERLEECINGTESRLYTRIAELEDKIVNLTKDLEDAIVNNAE